MKKIKQKKLVLVLMLPQLLHPLIENNGKKKQQELEIWYSDIHDHGGKKAVAISKCTQLATCVSYYFIDLY